MEYRHQAHAANRSDLVKHLCLQALRHWPGLTTIWDAFAAAPATPLAALPPQRRELLSALLRLKGPRPVTEFQESLRACRMPSGAACYPGSAPLLAQFDSVQTLILTDSNGQCIAQQEQFFQRAAGIQIQMRQLDSYQRGREVLQQGPDLVFIDPPFLAPREWDDVKALYDEIQQLCPSRRIVLWYPLRDDLVQPPWFSRLPRLQLTVHYDADRAFKGCAMVLLNFEASLIELLQPLAQWFRESAPLGIGQVELTD